MKVTVATPVLNEINFLPAWLTNVRRYATEIIVVDTGSTDGSLEFLREQTDIILREWHEKRDPYHWEEDKIRNWLIDNSNGDWIVVQPADELFDSSFNSLLSELQNKENDNFYIGNFPNVEFWGSLNRIRKRTVIPPVSIFRSPTTHKYRYSILRNWRGFYQPRLFRNCPEVRYAPTGNHCALMFKNRSRFLWLNSGIVKTFKDVPLYHFHFAFPKIKKINENRGDQRDNPNIKTVRFEGVLPIEVNKIDTIEDDCKQRINNL